MTQKLILTDRQVARLAYENTAWRGWDLIRAVAIAGLESGYNAYANSINDQDPTKASYMSTDCGLMQLNSYWTPKNPAVQGRWAWITSAEEWPVLVFTPVTNLQIAWTIWDRNAHNFGAWNTLTKLNSNPIYLHAARVAVNDELGLGI
jgi:hypothetical protein